MRVDELRLVRNEPVTFDFFLLQILCHEALKEGPPSAFYCTARDCRKVGSKKDSLAFLHRMLPTRGSLPPFSSRSRRGEKECEYNPDCLWKRVE
jgi:hypothetical protein